MYDLEMSKAARRVIEEHADIQPEEEVLIITDSQKFEIAHAVAAEARAIGAPTVIALKPKLEAHGNEPPETVASAMMSSDVMIDINTYALSHTEARRNAAAAGSRLISLRSVTKEMMLEGGPIDTDLDPLVELAEAVVTLHQATTTAHITSPEGTDITVESTDHPPLVPTHGLPPLKVGISPIEGTGEGTIVFDYSFDNLGVLDEPIEITFRDGLVSSISGGNEAEELQQIVERAGEGARNLAEAPSLGLNPDIKFTGSQATDKKKRGVVNFAIGDNIGLGGSTRSDIHLDGIILNGSVRFDDYQLIEDGTFLTDRVLEIADDLTASED